MYLIEGTTNQTNQEKIVSLCKPSDPDMFFINNTIQPLHTITAPPKPAETIGFRIHWHTPATTTVCPTYSVNQRLHQRFQPAITGRKIIMDNTTDDTPLLEENGCDLSKLLTLLDNLTLKDYTLIDKNKLW